jgi:hypothetical protein
MLIKSADDHSEDISELKLLLASKSLTRYERESLEHELYSMQKGADGEDDTAYFLNFHFRGSDGHLILHDLRIVLSDGRTAQIDHLLVNSFQDFYVLESKNWERMIVDKTGACTTGTKRRMGAESPLEQCKRHSIVLARAIEIDEKLRALTPRYRVIPRVLVAPKCHLEAPHHQEWYVKADIFYSQRLQEVESVPFMKKALDLPRYTTGKTLTKIGQALLELHNPTPSSWREKYHLPTNTLDAPKVLNLVVASIQGLASDVPDWGEDWFLLKRKPTPEIKKALNRNGYFAHLEKGDWIWRIKEKSDSHRAPPN